MVKVQKSKTGIPFVYCGRVKLGRYIPAYHAIELRQDGKGQEAVIISIRQFVTELSRIDINTKV